MQLIEGNRKVDIVALHSLGLKCLEHVQDLYPTSCKSIIIQTYLPQIEVMMLAKNMDEWEAAVLLYNEARTAGEKIWFMAAVKNLINEKKVEYASK